MAVAEPGSGKTLAYLLPSVHRMQVGLKTSMQFCRFASKGFVGVCVRNARYVPLCPLSFSCFAVSSLGAPYISLLCSSV